MRRVVVTGMGMVTALGGDLPTVWRRLIAGSNGIGPISFFDSSQYACGVAAEVTGLVPEEPGLDSFPLDFCRRGVQMFLRAAREAFRDARLDDGMVAPKDIGVGAALPVNYAHMGLLRHHFRLRNPQGTEIDFARVIEGGKQPVSSFFRRNGDMASAIPAKVLGLAGLSFGCDTACAASSFAVGQAFRSIQRGKVKAMVAGGGCAIITPIGVLAFSHLGALSKNRDPEKASRPFDRYRDGFVIGEGGGAVVLEDLESARSRKARIYGEITGFGVTTNAYNLTDPSPDGSSELQAMQRALRESSIAPQSVDYIAAHGTSTPKNDEVETAAIKGLFGDHCRKLLVSSNKGQLGHTLSTAGVTNLICAVKAIVEGVAPPTMHYENIDPNCDLDYVPNESRKARIDAALVNAFAFGGQNAVLAVRAI